MVDLLVALSPISSCPTADKMLDRFSVGWLGASATVLGASSIALLIELSRGNLPVKNHHVSQLAEPQIVHPVSPTEP